MICLFRLDKSIMYCIVQNVSDLQKIAFQHLKYLIYDAKCNHSLNPMLVVQFMPFSMLPSEVCVN